MENQNSTPEVKKQKWSRSEIIALFLFVISTIGFSFDLYYTYKISVDRDRQVKEIQTAFAQEQADKNSCVYTRDSLKEEIKQLSIYKTLTKAMVRRDEVTALLKYKVGDIVRLKTDSTLVVVSDIVIGGSKYEYYIKYEVIHKDGQQETIIPELIY